MIYIVVTWFNASIGHIYVIRNSLFRQSINLVVALDLLNTIFFFADFIAIAAKVDKYNCSNIDVYYYYDGYYYTDDSVRTICREEQAASGVAAAGFVFWLISSIWVIRFVYLAYQRGEGRFAKGNVEVQGTSAETKFEEEPRAPVSNQTRMDDPDV